MRGMKKSLCFLGACLLCLGLTSCAAAEQDAFQVQIICKSSGIQQIFWSCYLDGVFYGSGGMADLDGEELTAGKRTCPLFHPCLPRRCRSDWLLHRFFPLCGGQDHPLRHYGPGIYPRPVWSVLHCDTLRGRGNRLSGRTTVNIYRPDPGGVPPREEESLCST